MGQAMRGVRPGSPFLADVPSCPACQVRGCPGGQRERGEVNEGLPVCHWATGERERNIIRGRLGVRPIFAYSHRKGPGIRADMPTAVDADRCFEFRALHRRLRGARSGSASSILRPGGACDIPQARASGRREAPAAQQIGRGDQHAGWHVLQASGWAARAGLRPGVSWIRFVKHWTRSHVPCCGP